MNESTRPPHVWLWFTFPIVILLAIAAGGGVFITGLYRDNPYYVAQAVGQDFSSLVIVLPALIISAIFANRGSQRGRLVWLGILVYLIYTYVVAAFDNHFNSLFLVYVALLGCSLYALIGGLVMTNRVGMRESFTEKTPFRAVSIYLVVLAILFYFLWLSEVIPALIAGTIPQSIQDNGTATNAIHVLDMAWILPAFGITAVSLWRKQTLGYILAGALLSYTVLLALAILSMVEFMFWKGFPAVVPQLILFFGLFSISLGMLILYLKGLSPTLTSR